MARDRGHVEIAQLLEASRDRRGRVVPRSGITAPALAFFTIYSSPFVPAGAEADLRARIVKRREDVWKPSSVRESNASNTR